MNSLYVTTGRGQGTSFDVPSLCFLFMEDKGNDGSVFEDSIQTGAHFFFSFQITANIVPFSDCSCHCFDSDGFSFTFGGSLCLLLFHDMGIGKCFELPRTVPQPKSLLARSSF